jgi:hypothetical protein
MINYRPGIIVPAYSDPTRDDTEWNRLENAAGKLKDRLIVIANVENGPGAAFQQDYFDRINKLRQLGARVIGYVYTCHSEDPQSSDWSCPRAAGTSAQDAEQWYTWYPVHGIFFDQASRDTMKPDPDKAKHLAFYATLCGDLQMKHPGALVVLNFGSFPESDAYSKIGPIIQCVHEDLFAPPSPEPSFLQWTFDPLLCGNHPMDCAVLLHHTNWRVLPAAVARVKANKIGWYFMTDQAPDPWRHLPRYFEILVASVSPRFRFPFWWEFGRWILGLKELGSARGPRI